MTAIESESEVVSNLADKWFATVIQGDATDPDILRQAGVENADTITALTGETGSNLAVCMVAEELSSGMRTVTRVGRDVGKAYQELVDGVVFPERAGSRVALSEIEGSEVQTLADVNCRVTLA